MSLELILFGLFAILAVASAIGMLLSENAVHSALFLIGNFGCVAFMFLMLDAPFISMVQVAVYAGAIMVLFLFVIMLLGAEQTTDTTRRFRWLTGAATTLGASLLITLGLPLALGGAELPDPPGDDPLMRVVHAGQTPAFDAVDLTIEGGEMAAPLTLEGLQFGDMTEYLTFAPGDYTLTISPTGTTSALHRQDVTLAPGDIFTAAAYGVFDLELTPDQITFDIALLPNAFEPAMDGEARFVLFNGFYEGELALVDLGPDAMLSATTREMMPEDAEDEAAEPVTTPVITDRVFADGIGFGEAPQIVTIPAGDYTLAYVQADQLDAVNLADDDERASLEVLRLDDYAVEAATERTVLLVGEPPQVASGTANPRALGAFGDELLVTTAAAFGSPAAVGQILFTDFLLPVNLVGLLLLVGLVGVIVLTRPEGAVIQGRQVRRRKVSRPLTSVISQQTGRDVVESTPRLDPPAGD